MFKIERRQYPVGQGFFHSATITWQDANLHYVYDCGSENVDSLRREVSKYGKSLNGDLDLLFLSHLDNDHVNGLDDLLSLVRADTVVLPYLSIFERIALAVRAIERQNFSFNYFELIADPVGWFSARSVSRIIFVEASHDERLTAVEDINLPVNDRDFDWDSHKHKKHLKRSLSIDATRLKTIAGQNVTGQNSAQVCTVPCDRILPIVMDEVQFIGWNFLPFVHPEPKREIVFRRRVAQLWNDSDPPKGFPNERREFPRSISPWLFETLRDKKQRANLVDCYEEIRIDRNLTSMSLYSGPSSHSSNFNYSINIQGRKYDFNNEEDSIRTGWIGTGDANLLGQRRRQAFLRHYEQFRELVVTMALPHHGSEHNFHASIMLPFTKNCIVGASTSNSYQHPHEAVVNAVRASERFLIRIDENERSSMSETINFLY